MKNNLNNPNTPLGEIQIDITDETAQGCYANLAVIAHSAYDFVIDFIRVLPGVSTAKVQSRIILSPDNARRLLLALDDNIRKFDEMGSNAGFDRLLPPMGEV